MRSCSARPLFEPCRWGQLVVVSHDRWFCDRVLSPPPFDADAADAADDYTPRRSSLFVFEGSGAVSQFDGKYSDYFEALKAGGGGGHTPTGLTERITGFASPPPLPAKPKPTAEAASGAAAASAAAAPPSTQPAAAKVSAAVSREVFERGLNAQPAPPPPPPPPKPPSNTAPAPSQRQAVKAIQAEASKQKEQKAKKVKVSPSLTLTREEPKRPYE